MVVQHSLSLVFSEKVKTGTTITSTNGGTELLEILECGEMLSHPRWNQGLLNEVDSCSIQTDRSMQMVLELMTLTSSSAIVDPLLSQWMSQLMVVSL